MKALLVSLLFAVAYAKFDDKRICDSGAFACYTTEEVPKGTPKSVAELDRKCAVLVEQADCMSDLVDLCGNIFPVYPDDYFGRIKTKVHRTCDKDSALYQELAKNIECMGNTVHKEEKTCDQLGKDTIEKAKKEKGFSLYQWNKFMCAGYIVESSCKVAKIQETCGDDAETAALEVIKSFKGENGICMKDSYQDAVDMLESLDLEPGLKSQIMKHLKRIS